MEHPTANPQREQTAVGEAPGTAAERPAAAPDLFDLRALRLSQDFAADIAVTRVVTHLPVRKPGRQDFFRVHPDEGYRLDTAVIEQREAGETYLVLPAFRAALAQELAVVRLHLTITRQGTLALWPCKLPAPDGRPNAWHVSALDAAQRAMNQWTRVVADLNLGAYQVFVAAANLAEPEWPSLPFEAILRLAFQGNVIDRLDHPVIERLRGAV